MSHYLSFNDHSLILLNFQFFCFRFRSTPLLLVYFSSTPFLLFKDCYPGFSFQYRSFDRALFFFFDRSLLHFLDIIIFICHYSLVFHLVLLKHWFHKGKKFFNINIYWKPLKKTTTRLLNILILALSWASQAAPTIHLLTFPSLSSPTLSSTCLQISWNILPFYHMAKSRLPCLCTLPPKLQWFF